MNFIKFLKDIKSSILITAIVLIVIGLILLIIPQLAIDTVGFILGGGLITMGIITLFSFFRHGQNFSWYQSDIITGGLEIIFGLFVILYSGLIVSIIPLVFGIILFIHGISGIQRALEIKKYQGNGWILALALAVISLLFGLFCIISPFGVTLTVLRIIGIFLIYSGISDFISIYKAQKDLQKLHDELSGVPKDYEDATFREIK